MFNKRKHNRAFTLVELLIVIAVVSILFVVLVSRVDFATDKARTTGVQNDMHAIQYAIHQVAIEKGELIDDLNLLASQLNENLDSELMVRVEGNMLKTNATDPWGNEYQLRYNKGANNKGQLQIFSAGADNDYSTQDDVVVAVVCSPSASGTNVVVKNDLTIDETIREDGTIPNQPAVPEHTCSFNQQKQAAGFLKTAGNCTTQAVYFYSCECGAVGTATFTGSVDPSTHTTNVTYNYNQLNADNHTKVTVCQCSVILDTATETHNFINDVCDDCGFERHVHNFNVQDTSDEYRKDPATCTSPATYYYKCNGCTAKSDETYTYGKALDHNYTSSTITTQATCSASGVLTYTCSCGSTKMEMIPKKAHTEVTDQAVAATCTTTGLTEGKHCSVCNTVIIAQETVPANGHTIGAEANCTNAQECTVCHTKLTAALGHDYKSTVKQPTCTEAGYTTHTCSRCGDTYTDSNVAAKGHTEVTDKAVAATCTTTGLTAGKHCSVCNAVITAQTTVAALGHNIVSHDAKAATCTEKGYKAYEDCTRCSYTTYSEIAAKGHTLINGGTSNAHKTCMKCDFVDTNHSYTKTTSVAATCTSMGTSKYTCSCGYNYTKQDINALGHNIVTKFYIIDSEYHNAVEVCDVCDVVMSTTKEPHNNAANCSSCKYHVYTMLDGSNITVTAAQDVSFRSEAPYSEFEDVVVNGELVDKSNYTVSEGSTVITLKESYIATLENKSYTIAIVSTNGSAACEFNVKIGFIIPEGGQLTRYHNLSKTYDDFEYDVSYTTEIFYPGDVVAEFQVGDVYTYGDYKYCYGYAGCCENRNFAHLCYLDDNRNELSINGWSVLYSGEAVEVASAMLDNIYNIPVVSARKLFYWSSASNTLIETPYLPDTITDITDAFGLCGNLVTITNLPSSLVDMSWAFHGCSALQNVPAIPSSVLYMSGAFNTSDKICGELVVNANPITYTDWINVDFNTTQLTLSGTSNSLDTLGSIGKNYCSECNGTCKGHTVYALSGTWIFNDILVMPSQQITASVTFSDKSISFVGMDIDQSSLTYINEDEADSCEVYGPIGWFSTMAQTVTFESEQIVSKEFYEWFTANATLFENGFIIPEGGQLTRYHNLSKYYDDWEWNLAYDLKEVFVAGDLIQEFKIGDIYTYGDYEYCYGYTRCCEAKTFNHLCPLCDFNDLYKLDGWAVHYIGSDEAPSSMLDNVAGMPVVSARNAFYWYSGIVQSPILPDTITDMMGCFGMNPSLTTITNFPANVENLAWAFESCSNIVNMPSIPETVTRLDFAFLSSDLNNITIVINANPANYQQCFDGLDFLSSNVKLSGLSTILDEIGNTGTNYCKECNGTCTCQTTLITFTIYDQNSKSNIYYAEEGMTWAEWVSSEYNTNNYYFDGNYIMRDDSGYQYYLMYPTYHPDASMNPDGVIQADYIYREMLD